jgi:hypothetical protein
MATPKSLSTLEKTKEAVANIKHRLQPVLQRLRDDEFGEATSEAQASVALSVGMMKYMGARLRGLDQGRKADDPLRKELNNMKAVLAEIKKRKLSNNNATESSTGSKNVKRTGGIDEVKHIANKQANSPQSQTDLKETHKRALGKDDKDEKEPYVSTGTDKSATRSKKRQKK